MGGCRPPRRERGPRGSEGRPRRQRTGPCPSGTLLVTLLIFSSPAAAATWTVTPGGPLTLAAALEAAAPGDAIVVRGGTHPGPLAIDRSLSIRGEGWPIVDGGGAGTVVAIGAAGVTVEGFVVRGSGSSLDEENSGIAVDGAAGVRIAGNRLEDVLFGVYLREAPSAEVVGNEIQGKALDLPRRGDAVRVWSSDGARIEDNAVKDSRDVVLWYSSDLLVAGNRVTGGRYGLHFMYCDDAEITGNLLARNSVGAFLMYSRRLRLKANTIAGNHGPSGYGVGLKDMDDAVVAGNLFAGNRIGVFLDNTPREVRSITEIADNLFAANDIGIALLPNVRRGTIRGNSFVENPQQVSVEGGGGDPEANLWRGNHWSDYAGYDADGDGVGDVAYRSDELFGELADRDPRLRLFVLSPATRALELAARAFPVVRPRPRLVDGEPLMRPHRLPAVPALGHVGDSRLLPLGGTMIAGALLMLFSPGLLSRGRRGDEEEASAIADDVRDEEAPIIEVRALSKRFGDRPALEHVSFTIRRGEAVAIWGPNGAGKTTALRAMLGVIPFEGTVRIGGADPWRDGKAARAQVGFVPQEIRFPGDLDVAEALGFYARLRRAPAALAEGLLDRLGLAEEAAKRVGELSGGLRQRLALGVALLGDPPILFLDEPTANLDLHSRAGFLDLLQELKARGKTLVYSSHRPEEVFALADRVIHLEAGLLVSDGPPSPAILESHREAELWLRLDPGDVEAAAAALAAAGFACRRLGPHLVVDVAAERKVEPIRALLESGIRLADFALEVAGRANRRRGEEAG